LIAVDDWILEKLLQRSGSNFLFARLMIEQLEHELFCINDITAFVKDDMPKDITEMYKRIFRHEYQKSQHKYIRYVAVVNYQSLSRSLSRITPVQPSILFYRFCL
jgi:hypothetical protein